MKDENIIVNLLDGIEIESLPPYLLEEIDDYNEEKIQEVADKIISIFVEG